MLIHANWKEICKRFWKYKKKVWEWNIWYGIILQMPPDSSLVTVWAAHSQDRERGGREKGDCKAIHEPHFVFSRGGSLVTYWSIREEGGLAPAGNAGTRSLRRPTRWRRPRRGSAALSPTPCPHRAFQLLCLGCRPALQSLIWMYHTQSFKRKVNPSQWSSYNPGSPFPSPRIYKNTSYIVLIA